MHGDGVAGNYPPVVSVVGWSGSGKTSFLERLIPELKSRGYRVGVIKHHPGSFEIDRPGKDTWRHARAGADAVAIAGSERMALIKKVSNGDWLEEVLGLMSGVDIIITEGLKSRNFPKIEVRRSVSDPPACPPGEVMALVCEDGESSSLPCFRPGDVRDVAALLEERFLKRGVLESWS